MPRKIILPKTDDKGKPYISYSQFSTWKSSKKDYFKSYFFGERFDGNAYTEFGNKVGEALEKGDFTGFDGLEKLMLQEVTRLDEFERKVELDFGDFYLFGYIDTNDKELETIVDYKTGALDKEAVYASPDYVQLDLYAAAIEQETGKLPKEAFVILVEREGNPYKNEELKVGKSLRVINKDLNPQRIKDVKSALEKAAIDISHHFRVFNELNSIKV